MTTTDKNGKTVNVTKGVQGFQEIRRAEAAAIDLEDLRDQADAAQAIYCRALAHRLATDIAEKYPEAAYLEFDMRSEFDPEVVPWMTDVLDANERPVEGEVVDVIRNEFVSKYNERDFGDWVEGGTISLIPARHPAYVHGDTEGAREAIAAEKGESAALDIVKENCRHIGYNSLTDMIERLHDRGQVDITDSAELTTEELAVLGERHFSGLVDRFCDTLEPAEPTVGVDELGQAELDRFKRRGVMELGASTTTMEALEAAMDRAEIPAGSLDSMTRDTMDALEDHTERALDRLANDVRIFLNE
ncbi:hypothetical protein [Aeromicrobium sp. 179-A 4D2 NHS]|uniref:hypothetical protein n=1 Tax=Aeromicrobium sp. 179-A 4D2 NHS TaxID=3142375 RepID=UPI00399FDBC0